MRRPLRLRSILFGMTLAVVSAGCTSVPPEELSVPLEPATTQEASEVDEPADPAEPETPPDAEAPSMQPVIDGELAIGGLPGLVVADGAGTPLRTSFPSGVGTQPAWSRDGERAIAFVPTAGGGAVVVSTDDDEFAVAARRPYFFFSWSGDNAYVAALGPGPQGTTLDILTPEGELATDGAIDTASFYLAWEPGGDDLVVHLDDELFLVRDPLDLATREPLGVPGQSFLAPAWIPGTRDIVIVDDADGGRVIRLDVDDRSEEDLGPVGGSAGFTVSADGTRLFLTHDGPNVERRDDIDISLDAPVQETLAASEVIVLETGARTPINDELTIWAEWAPDGSALAMLQTSSDGGVWLVADESGLRELGPMRATSTFLRNYIFFSWQFIESPRIWAPDADAIVYAAVEDGVPGVFVHATDGTRERVSDGDVAFFAPDPDGGAPSPA
ncbi:MAG: hypothetical protein AAF081_11235 [Actinomycetota bacterium]